MHAAERRIGIAIAAGLEGGGSRTHSWRRAGRLRRPHAAIFFVPFVDLSPRFQISLHGLRKLVRDAGASRRFFHEARRWYPNSGLPELGRSSVGPPCGEAI